MGFYRKDGNTSPKRSRIQSIRLLDSDTVSLRRDLRWWADRAPVRILTVDEIRDNGTGDASQRPEKLLSRNKVETLGDSEKIRIESHKVWGRGEIMNTPGGVYDTGGVRSIPGPG